VIIGAETAVVRSPVAGDGLQGRSPRGEVIELCEVYGGVSRPQNVTVSSGEGHEYCHSKEEVQERVADIGASLLRTDKMETIEVVSDGEQLRREAGL
jgi:hypothetical protein